MEYGEDIFDCGDLFSCDIRWDCNPAITGTPPADNGIGGSGLWADWRGADIADADRAIDDPMADDVDDADNGGSMLTKS